MPTADRLLVSPAFTIGVDIGGTKVSGGVVDAHGAVVSQLRRATPPRDPVATEDTIADVVRALDSTHPVGAVGIGAAGFVDGSGSTVLFSPHLAWRNEPLREVLEARLGLPVLVENDANAAAWAEWRFGAAVDEPVVLCVNLGTGIGGGIVVNGHLWRGGWGMAGEFGHMAVVPDGHPCECGNRGCWEQYASGNALVRAARAVTGASSPAVGELLSRAEGDTAGGIGHVVTQAAQDGDATSVALVADVGRWLGIGLANLAAAFDPTVFVVGGGVSEAGELLLEPARDAFTRSLTGRGHRPHARIVAALLGNDAGFIGAADLARELLPQAR